MLSATYTLWGILFGLVLSAPVGPVNIICLRRALFGRPSDSFLIGLGAALGDTFYAALAAFGLHAIFDMIEVYSTPLKFVGGGVMCLFAIRIWRSSPQLPNKSEIGGVVRGAFGALVLTITNPGVFLGFLTLFALAGLGNFDSEGMGALMLIGGVFAGSSLWWAFLATVAKRFKYMVNDQMLVNINHISAGVIILFAAGTIVCRRNYRKWVSFVMIFAQKRNFHGKFTH